MLLKLQDKSLHAISSGLSLVSLILQTPEVQLLVMWVPPAGSFRVHVMQVARARSPVIPKRMRMDEEPLRPLAAEVNKAAEAARRAASRSSQEVASQTRGRAVASNPPLNYGSEPPSLTRCALLTPAGLQGCLQGVRGGPATRLL